MQCDLFKKLAGAPPLVESHLTTLKPTEIQLDNLQHVFLERGAGEVIVGRTEKIWESQIDAAKKMYTRTKADVRPRFC